MADSDNDSDSSADVETRNAKRKSSADSYPLPDSTNEEEKAKKPRIAFSVNNAIDSSEATKKKKSTPIFLKLGVQKPKEGPNVVKSSSASVAKAFNTEEDDDDCEEMPPEAKMRMRNIGRETPTSAGPNSFGKTRQGFCDTKKMFERKMKNKIDSFE